MGQTPIAVTIAGSDSGGGAGIYISFTASGNVVQGNYIGTDPTGMTAMPNSDGVVDSGIGDIIGGTTASARNVISGNARIGVYFFGGTQDLVEGNYIGINAQGTAVLGNIFGILANSGAAFDTIGGSTAGAGNVIGGNPIGIEIDDAGSAYGTNNLLIEGNFIGTDPTATLNFGNSNGIYLTGNAVTQGVANNTIGGNAPGAGNVIANNTVGVEITGVSAKNNVVVGNFIGTDPTGTASIGNGIGVFVAYGAFDNTIGDTVAGAGNLIAHNTGAGVAIGASASDAATVGNTIRGNSIHDNGGLGIDLGADGVTLNDVSDFDAGANNLQNFPVVTAAVAQYLGGTRLVGALSGPANTAFTLDFYASPGADPSGHWEGQRYLTHGMVTTAADGDAHFVILISVPTMSGEVVTVTATDSAGNTSEFSAFARVVAGPAVGGTNLGGVRNAPPVISLPPEPETPLNTPVFFGNGKGATAPSIAITDNDNHPYKINEIMELTLTVGHGTLKTRAGTGSSVTFTGSLTQVNALLDGMVYSPTTGFAGADHLHIQVTDFGDPNEPLDTAISIAHLAIHVGPVNHPPVITLPAAPETPVNVPVSFGANLLKFATHSPPITITDVDSASAKGDKRLYQVTLTVSHGALRTNAGPIAPSVTISGRLVEINAVLTTLVYFPENGFAGTDILRVRVLDFGNPNDPLATAAADLTIHVGPFNRPPVVTVPLAPLTSENTPVTFGPNGLKGATSSPPITIADPGSFSGKDATLYELTLTASHGTLEITSKVRVTGRSVTISGTRAQINAALTTLVYRPDPGFVGLDVLEIAITDFGDPHDPLDDVVTTAFLGIFVNSK